MAAAPEVARPAPAPGGGGAMTQPLSPDAQFVIDAAHREPAFNPDGRPNLSGAVAAALRAAADQVVPHSPTEAISFTNEAIRLNRMGIRCKYLAIADELEGFN